MANVSALLLYLLCVAASYELQRRNIAMAGTPFDLPASPAIQLMAGAGIIWLLLQATAREWTVQALVLAAAVTYYLIKGRVLRSLSAADASRAQDER
jgi:hypothetical protein